MDNYGTINVNITTVGDYNGTAGKQKFRVPYVTDMSKYSQSTVTKNLSSFMSLQTTPF
jgi:hypothetical protein